MVRFRIEIRLLSILLFSCTAYIFSKKKRVTFVHFQILKWLRLNCYIFESGYMFWVKGDFAVLWVFLYTAKFVFGKICNMLILYFAFFRDILKLWIRNILSFCVCHPCYQCVLQYVPLLVVKLLIYCKKTFSHEAELIYLQIYTYQ